MAMLMNCQRSTAHKGSRWNGIGSRSGIGTTFGCRNCGTCELERTAKDCPSFLAALPIRLNRQGFRLMDSGHLALVDRGLSSRQSTVSVDEFPSHLD